MSNQNIRPPDSGGLAIDKFGNAVVDPTKNVLDLVAGEVKRLNDIADLRERHSREVAEIRETHQKELGDKEASRLDSIRQVDVLNQAGQAKSALDAIQALAATTITNADNIRNALTATAAANAKQVTDLAASIAASTAATSDALSIRIAALEKAQAEGVGKGRIIDPQIEALIKTVGDLATVQSTKQGSGQGMASLWGFLVGGLGIMIAVITLILRLTGQ